MKKNGGKKLRKRPGHCSAAQLASKKLYSLLRFLERVSNQSFSDLGFVMNSTLQDLCQNSSHCVDPFANYYGSAFWILLWSSEYILVQFLGKLLYRCGTLISRFLHIISDLRQLLPNHHNELQQIRHRAEQRQCRESARLSIMCHSGDRKCLCAHCISNTIALWPFT